MEMNFYIDMMAYDGHDFFPPLSRTRDFVTEHSQEDLEVNWSIALSQHFVGGFVVKLTA